VRCVGVARVDAAERRPHSLCRSVNDATCCVSAASVFYATVTHSRHAYRGISVRQFNKWTSDRKSIYMSSLSLVPFILLVRIYLPLIDRASVNMRGNPSTLLNIPTL
jgi:hypothetical protein